ncbi:hypothetical protein BVY04_04610 [bacterium M21]|nr:hypothetical protein BVY04_04610 [bacterium M21]
MQKGKTSIVRILVILACLGGLFLITGLGLSWYSKRREHKRRQEAAINLKRIGESLLLYSQSFDGLSLKPPALLDSDTQVQHGKTQDEAAETVAVDKSNGLSVTLRFEIKDSSFESKIVHPVLDFRNESDKPIKLLKSIYHAGEFSVRHLNGSPVIPPDCMARGGPAGTEVVTIAPGKTLEFDAYDYGMGIHKGDYAFNPKKLS